MLLSLTLSLINRKKHQLILSFLALFACNIIFFQSTWKKDEFLSKYTSHIPSYSNQDIYVISKDSDDILHPKSFLFPYVEKIQSHDDVLGVTALSSEGEKFYKTSQNPQVLVVSLKKGASVKKWMDTFQANADFTAMNPGYYKHLYNKALISRNEALYSYSALLSLISTISFIGMIVFAGMFPFAIRNEIKVFLLEGVTVSKAIGFFTGVFSVIVSTISCIVASFNLILTISRECMLNLLVHAIVVEILAVLLISTTIIAIARSRFGKNRIN